MSKTNATETATLVFWLRPGDALPTRPTALFLALCESDPGETGDMAGAEIAAGRLTTHRLAITFDAPTDTTANSALITFGAFLQACTISHWAVCFANVRGVDDAIYYGARTGGSVTMAIGESLDAAAGSIDVSEA